MGPVIARPVCFVDFIFGKPAHQICGSYLTHFIPVLITPKKALLLVQWSFTPGGRVKTILDGDALTLESRQKNF